MQRTSACLALALWACHGSNAKRPGPPPPASVKLATLSPTPVRDSTEYIATLKSRRSVLLQPQVEGQISRIFVKSGDVVEADAPLMQIDPSRQQASVSSAQATRTARLATLAYAKQQFERSELLYQGGAVSKQELDQARANYQSAQAEVAALGAQIRQNEVQLDYYRITAPGHGVVGDIPVRVGDHVTPATKLTTLDENDLLEAYISVPVERAKLLRPDMEVQLVDSEGATIATGRLSFIAPQVNEETQSVLIKTVVRNDGGALRAAQFVRARVVWSTHQGLMVPALAVQRVSGQAFVYVAEMQGDRLVARQRPVALGELIDNAYVALGGVQAGDRVVSAGMQKLADGIPLRAQE